MSNYDLISKYIHPLYPEKTDIKPSGSIKKPVKAILFDIYGTLIISGSGDINATENKVTNRHKIEALFKKYSVNSSIDEVNALFVETVKKEHLKLKKNGHDYPEIIVEKIWMDLLGLDNLTTASKYAIEFEFITNPVYPMPNLKKTIKYLSSKNYLGIISNAQFYTPMIIEWFLGSNLKQRSFNDDLLFFSYKFGYAKPSSFLFKLAKKNLKTKNLHPSSVLYVGNDMLNDIYTAQKEGFQTALFAGDKRSLRLREDNVFCKTLSPDITITDLAQLLDYL